MKYQELAGDSGKKGVDFAGIAEAKTELLRLMHSWRESLGAERGLLEDYLTGFLQAMIDTANTYNTAEVGFDEALSELRGLLRNIKEGKTEEAQRHPFYPQVAAYLAANPTPQDGLYYESCCVGLVAEYAPFAARQYVERCNIRFEEALREQNIGRLRDALLTSIPAITAEGLEYLNSLIGQVLVFTPPSGVFMQAMFDQLLYSFTAQDGENGATLLARLLGGDPA